MFMGEPGFMFMGDPGCMGEPGDLGMVDWIPASLGWNLAVLGAGGLPGRQGGDIFCFDFGLGCLGKFWGMYELRGPVCEPVGRRGARARDTAILPGGPEEMLEGGLIEETGIDICDMGPLEGVMEEGWGTGA